MAEAGGKNLAVHDSVPKPKAITDDEDPMKFLASADTNLADQG